VKHTRVIGLGNTILTDDGVGVYIAREIARRLPAGSSAPVDVVETEVAGFDLIELMAGWGRVILVDAINFDDTPPGTVLRIDPNDLCTSLRIRSVHEIDLPTALELGRRLGFQMPEELIIVGVQAGDSLTLGERLTPPVEHGMRRAVEMIWAELGSVVEVRAHA
jgi:hydrogenase maturation protease